MKKNITHFLNRKKLTLMLAGLFLFFIAASQGFMSPIGVSFLNKGKLENNLLKNIDREGSGRGTGAPGHQGNTLNGQGIKKAKATDLPGNQQAGIGQYEPFMAALAEPGGPILVVSAAANPFSKYATEILLAEGLNEYASSDISAVTAGMLSTYDVVILGDIPLTSAQVTLFTDWTNAGGLLIALSPDPQLAPLLGLTAAGGSLANKYLLVQTASGPGKGIVNETIQYQSTADLYTLNGATALATLYSDANTATPYPAVSMRTVGTLGGKAVAFTYDLARSVVYTRQGNPAWAGQERDGTAPIRSDDQFYSDWVNLNKVAIPMADEQQRLLANIITQNARKPLPRFWYLPRGLKAAVVMTGDDHGYGGTKARFNQYLQQSTDNSAEAVADWRAIRGTSYIYPNTPITDAQAKAFEQQGFEIALHLSTDCQNFTASAWDQFFNTQLAQFGGNFPSLAAPVTNRTHCIAWSDWHTQPKAGAPHGIRLDANYYYWPAAWVKNRPGMFSGSGIPMRFTEVNGTLIDSYQLVTQMTDEADQVYPFTVDNLLDKALGPEGYYGVFCANMHTDADDSDGSDKIVASAKARNVPVISAKQLLTWLDGRNGSAFGAMSWDGDKLNFTISVASGAHKLQGMLPITDKTGQLEGLTVNGTPVTYQVEKIKGIDYAFFTCTPGNYVADYNSALPPNQEPTVALTSPATGATFTAPATIAIAANAADTDGTIAKVEFYQGSTKLGEDLTSPYSFSWSNVAAGTYSLTARATDNSGTLTASAPVSVVVNAACPCTVFKDSDAPDGSLLTDGLPIQLGMKFRATVNGNVTGVRFYKQAGNTGTHTGQLYSSTGTLLAQATFINETPSGWQQVNFSSPVPITANTTYVITYHSSSGFYSGTGSYFNQAAVSNPLRGLATGEDGPNGVFLYNNTPAFPANSFGAGNYWVDAVFTTGAPNPPPSVAITAPTNGASFTAPATIAISANASDTNGGTVTKVEFFEGANKLGEDATSPYSFSWSNVAAGTYSLTARATDNEGAVTTSAPVSVTVTPAPAGATTVFQASDAPTGSLQNDGSALQLGMKFRASVNGTVTGVRFYKQAGNTGTHTGQLYSSTGTLLAQATFINETASGWQQVNFSSPVPITANTTYVISYHSGNGFYSVNGQGFNQAIVNGPLTGLQNGSDGPNGLYLYTNTPARPTNNFSSSNYFVDLVFTANNAAAPTTAARLDLALSKAGQLLDVRLQEGVEVYPNPFSDRATVRFVLAQGGPYTLGLYDAKGKLVEVLGQGQANAGELNAIEVNGGKLAKGLYLVRLQTNTGARAAKLLLNR
jgi:hypothetical protein